MSIEYVKGKPYFCDTSQKIKQYPYLDKNIECDVLIIGGGINGAIANYFFSNEGIDCVLIDKGRIGYLSTSCATSLLEYQTDDHANYLKKYLDKETIKDVYNLGLNSLSDLDKLIKKIGNKCHYSKRPTLLYTLKQSEKKELKREFDFRIENGFEVEFYDSENNPFSFPLEAGIYAKNGGAEFNSYLFTKQMLENSNTLHSRIFENTKAIKIIKISSGLNKVLTNYGCEITCKKIIASTGYNTSLFTDKKLCEKLITYSVVTNPLKNFTWKNKTLLQDNSDPYHYLRLTHDNRILVGGGDIPFKKDFIDEKKAETIYNELFNYVQTLFPHIANKITPEYKFAGTFSATKNNLAVFGESAENSDVWFCLGYGANGIVYCIFGAQMLVQKYKGKSNLMEKFFSPSRKPL